MSHHAGPQLDALIAAGFHEWSARGIPTGYSRRGGPEQPAPRYSTDIAAAWQLVTWLQAMRFDVAVMTAPRDRNQLGAWTCAASNGTIATKSSADTAALAVSRAMLAILTELERG